MTNLSVNLNKIALLRNSRGSDFPNLTHYARRFLSLGVHGITIHPRPDERHIRPQDARDLTELLADHPAAELNIEGYPSPEFLALVRECRPAQCTLVPDEPGQLTSDHGWDFSTEGSFVGDVAGKLKGLGIRTAVFCDPDVRQVELAAQTGADRIELYTESYARAHRDGEADEVHERFRRAALRAREVGLGVNAGHDLNLNNLPRFLTIEGVLEVSIGHALVVECIEHGMQSVVRRYLSICGGTPLEPAREGR